MDLSSLIDQMDGGNVVTLPVPKHVKQNSISGDYGNYAYIEHFKTYISMFDSGIQ